MRVLHVLNTAGVASVLAKYQAKILGWKTWVIARKRYDPFGLTIYGEAVGDSKYWFALRVMVLARKYSLIHVHDFDRIVPVLKKLYSKKPVVLHYHGTKIRGQWNRRRKYWSKADALIVATPDLLQGAPDHAVYLPNPVDTELFRPLPHIDKEAGTALFIYDNTPKFQASLKWAQQVAERLKLRLVVHHRALNPIPYPKLPEFRNRFEYFIDHSWVPALSKTALEALACGLKVIKWNGEIIENLPPEHKPEFVVRQVKKIYESLIH